LQVVRRLTCSTLISYRIRASTYRAFRIAWLTHVVGNVEVMLRIARASGLAGCVCNASTTCPRGKVGTGKAIGVVADVAVVVSDAAVPCVLMATCFAVCAC
jgi:hypothetical protein